MAYTIIDPFKGTITSPTGSVTTYNPKTQDPKAIIASQSSSSSSSSGGSSSGGYSSGGSYSGGASSSTTNPNQVVGTWQGMPVTAAQLASVLNTPSNGTTSTYQAAQNQIQPLSMSQGDVFAPINTGDPQVDAIANQLLSDMYGQYMGVVSNLPGNPTQAQMDAIMAEVERLMGPQIEQLRTIAQNSYNKQLEASRTNANLSNQGLDAQLSRGQQDVSQYTGQAQENLATQKTILGRSYQEALQDMQLAYAANGRALSGRRVEDEQKLEQERQLQESQLNLETQRYVDDLMKEQARLGVDVDTAKQRIANELGLTESQITTSLAQYNQELEDIKNAKFLEMYNSQQNSLTDLLPALANQTWISDIPAVQTIQTPTSPLYKPPAFSTRTLSSSGAAFDTIQKYARELTSGTFKPAPIATGSTSGKDAWFTPSTSSIRKSY